MKRAKTLSKFPEAKQLRNIKQFVKQISGEHANQQCASIHNVPISASNDGVPGATRTRDPLLRSYTIPLFSGLSKAKLLFPAYPCFSYKTTFFLHYIEYH